MTTDEPTESWYCQGVIPTQALVDEICGDCLTHQGLCARHAVGVLPQLRRNIAWLKLMGNAAVEQKARQTVKPTRHVSPEGKAHAQRKATARQTARSKRRGLFGLLRALAQR